MTNKKFSPRTDGELAEDVKEIVDALVVKANELASRDMAVNFNLAVGAPGEPITVNNFSVIKKIA